jgi:hypothetical protein
MRGPNAAAQEPYEAYDGDYLRFVYEMYIIRNGDETLLCVGAYDRMYKYK